MSSRYPRGRIPHELGRAAAAPQLRHYLRATAPLPAAPPFEYLDGVVLPMWGNDVYGDCTCATEGALIASWSHAATGTPIIVADADVLALYARTGFKSGDPTTDNGAQEPDVLGWMTQFGLAGHTIDGHAYIDHTNLQMVHQAAWLFGGVSLDLALPKGLDAQTDAGRWELAGAPTGNLAPGADGYHEIALVGVSQEGGALLFIGRTWGTRVEITEEWFKAYVTGAWAQRCKALFTHGAVAANGVDLAAWNADLARVGTQG